MRRETREPRPDLKQEVEKLGLTFHTLEGQPYWNEAAVYQFTSGEIEILESASNRLHEMCLAAVEHVVANDLYSRLGIPEVAHQVIARVWEQDPPALYGRFDLSFNGSGDPKLLEYNADTPTSLLEAAVIQWHWLQEVQPESDQFNSIWEGLVDKWKELNSEGYLGEGLVHFGCMDAPEDVMTTAVLMDTATEAGLEVNLMGMGQIGWDLDNSRFLDQNLRPIQTLFKLYPWEWILSDKFGPMALQTCGTLQWIEPIWKMVLSNKAILATLWEMFPGHPNLLPAYLDGPHELTNYVSKPILGREGSNVTIHAGEERTRVPGPYEDGPFLYQAYAPLPVFEGNHAVIGSWIIDGEARGIGVRESDGPVTEDHARFVPHYF